MKISRFKNDLCYQYIYIYMKTYETKKPMKTKQGAISRTGSREEGFCSSLENQLCLPFSALFIIAY